MTNEELRIQSRKGAPQIKIAGGIWVVGSVIIMVASVLGVVLALTKPGTGTVPAA